MIKTGKSILSLDPIGFNGIILNHWIFGDKKCPVPLSLDNEQTIEGILVMIR